MQRLAGLFVTTFLWGSALAAPVTFDFNDIGPDDNMSLAAASPIDDFYVGWAGGGAAGLIGANLDFGGAGSNGSGYATTAWVSYFSLYRSDSGWVFDRQPPTDKPFSLHSLDVADAKEIIGHYANGDTISMALSLDPKTWTTINFGAEWSNVVWVELYGTAFNRPASDPLSNIYMNLDNVVMTAVPVPPAIWLFGSALAGLGCIRGKQTV